MNVFERLGLEFGRGLCRALCNCECRNPVVAGRFGGFFTLDPITGEIVMATQQLVVGQQFTCPLIFTDINNNVVNPGPVGTIASSDPSVTVSLSANGQSANALMNNPNVTATLTWSGTGANGPFTFTVDVTDAVVSNAAVAGAFGQFVSGNTP